MPMAEEQAVSDVLSTHTPQNIIVKKRKGGTEMPKGAARYLPTSQEHREILQKRADANVAKVARTPATKKLSIVDSNKQR